MKTNRKRIVLTILTIILGLGISLGAIYYIYYMKDQRENSLNSGLVRLNFTEGNNNINLLTIPMVDDEGLKGTPYTFTLENTSSVPVNAKIKLELNNTTNIDLGAVRYAVLINEEKIKKDYVHDNLILYEKENMLSGETLNVKLYFWVDYYYDKPDKIFSAKIVSEGESIDTLATEPITVTLDPDGGTLPTPTRDGYEFLGWNGKNMFNSMQLLNAPNVTLNNNIYKGLINDFSITFGKNEGCFIVNNFEVNKRYTISFIGTRDLASTPYFIFEYSDGLDDIGYWPTENKKYYTSKDNRDVINLCFSYGSGRLYYITLSNIQLEEGEEATEYEPYYITSNTKVVQNQNHTLKAIWKANE